MVSSRGRILGAICDQVCGLSCLPSMNLLQFQLLHTTTIYNIDRRFIALYRSNIHVNIIKISKYYTILYLAQFLSYLSRNFVFFSFRAILYFFCAIHTARKCYVRSMMRPRAFLLVKIGRMYATMRPLLLTTTAGFRFQVGEVGSSMVSTEEGSRAINFHDFRLFIPSSISPLPRRMLE